MNFSLAVPRRHVLTRSAMRPGPAHWSNTPSPAHFTNLHNISSIIITSYETLSSTSDLDSILWERT